MSAAKICPDCRRPVCTDEDDATCKGKPVCHAPWGDDGECEDVFRARARDALEALAVVAPLLKMLAERKKVIVPTPTGEFHITYDETERASLVLLAKIGRGE